MSCFSNKYVLHSGSIEPTLLASVVVNRCSNLYFTILVGTLAHLGLVYRDDNTYYIVVLDIVAICVIAIVLSIDRNITHHI